MNGFAIQIGFKGELLSRIQKAFEEVESPVLAVGGQPHLSLAVFYRDQKEKFVSSTFQFARKLRLTKVSVDGVGSFPGDEHVAFLSVALNNDLSEAHDTLHALLENEKVESHFYYQPGIWKPHITISMGDETIKEKCLERIPQMNLFGELEVDAVRVVKFRPVKVINEIKITEQTGTRNR